MIEYCIVVIILIIIIFIQGYQLQLRYNDLQDKFIKYLTDEQVRLQEEQARLKKEQEYLKNIVKDI